MKLLELVEGLMKRSDPYISGARSGPRPPVQAAKPTQPTKPVQATQAKTSHRSRMTELAKKAKIDPAEVDKIWSEEKDKVDSKNSQRWAIVTNNVKKRLGLT